MSVTELLIEWRCAECGSSVAAGSVLEAHVEGILLLESPCFRCGSSVGWYKDSFVREIEIEEQMHGVWVKVIEDQSS